MKTAVYYQPGCPEVFRYEDVPDPEPAPDGVLVRVEAISIEGGDTLHRASGEVTGGLHIVGYQAAGTVVAAGDRVTGFRPGERVVTAGMDGSHAELRAVPEQACWAIPAGLSTDEAACVPVAFGTAHDALFEFGRLGINYRAADFAAQARRETGGHGADVILDGVGGQVLAQSLGCLAYRSRCVSFGDAGCQHATPVDISGPRHGNQSVTGYFLGRRADLRRPAPPPDRRNPGRHRRRAAAGGHRPRLPAGRSRAAHAWIESRQAFGRVRLKP